MISAEFSTEAWRGGRLLPRQNFRRPWYMLKDSVAGNWRA
jgi:hypothetical protein